MDGGEHIREATWESVSMMLQLVSSRGHLSDVRGVLVSPHSALGSWFHEFPAIWFDGTGFSEKAGAVVALYSSRLKTSVWLPGAG